MNPIEYRQARFLENPDIWNTKLTKEELDFYKPRRETLASWISDVERAVSSLRFHPAWGRACTDNRFMQWVSAEPKNKQEAA